MTVKQFVQQRVPSANLETQTTNGGQKYYLVRRRGHAMYMASGNTPSEAWKKAKELVKDLPIVQVQTL